jgi:hypothetical protein
MRMDRHLISDPQQVAGNDKLRSRFVECLLTNVNPPHRAVGSRGIPRTLVQFWDDAHAIPQDVQTCLDTWSSVEGTGFERLLFDDTSSEQFIRSNFDSRHSHAFTLCRHPAMRADYFRLCFILAHGGVYVDADDEYQQTLLDDFVGDGLLKLRPLCYDITTDAMVNPILQAGASESENHIFYVNNNPLIAPPVHPVIANALERATTALLSERGDDRDIQTITGPGNLTASLVAHAVADKYAGRAQDFELIVDWDSVAISKWPLGYRSDHRNWRHWTRDDG